MRLGRRPGERLVDGALVDEQPRRQLVAAGRLERRTQRRRAEVQQAGTDATAESLGRGQAVCAWRRNQAACWSDGEGRC